MASLSIEFNLFPFFFFCSTLNLLCGGLFFELENVLTVTDDIRHKML